jgi:hypothetical protein
MNYYAQGGQAHGLKSLAQELPKYGRYGDDMVAHISSDEARMLQAMGGSGTINPQTGLPEFFLKKLGNIVAAPFRAVNEVVKAVPIIGPAIDRGLVSLDKAVGSAIPGGWNTLAQTALAFTPLGLPAKVGLAALGGSGAFGPNGKFNLQKALLSGALAYGANQLTSGLENAGGSASAGPEALGDLGGAGFTPAATESASGIFSAAPQALGDLGGAGVDSTIPSAVGSFAAKTGENLAAAGSGIKNLAGFGPEGISGISTAATNFAQPITGKGLTALGVGAMGLSSFDEQQKALDTQLASGSIAHSEYDAQSARIAEGRARAEQAVRDNPYQFAAGGLADSGNGLDEPQGLFQGNMSNGFMNYGSTPSYASGGNVSTPRFLSGGGDGMSDSIQATINGKQEARLADGEFVIPADVVSHLGNGSSKAGAKRLYSMMDKVRSARTGTKKQAPAVNTNRLMPA